jgi:hypothetical protein
LAFLSIQVFFTTMKKHPEVEGQQLKTGAAISARRLNLSAGGKISAGRTTRRWPGCGLGLSFHPGVFHLNGLLGRAFGPA